MTTTNAPARRRDRALESGERPTRDAASTGTLTDRAYHELEERIVTLQIKPGEFLSENTLSTQLGIGRTPIREALQRLVREGLVIVLPRKGILVSQSDPQQQLLVLEVRRELERLLARTAAARADAGQRTRFTEIAKGMDTSARNEDDLAFMRLDLAHNLLMLEAAHNDYAARAMRMLNGLSRRFWYVHYKQTADLPLCAKLHAEQARAIAKGDVAKAASATDRLMDYTEAFTRAAASAPALETTTD